jgi:5-methylcytosine-specific restriction endonuclease McrA
MTGPSTNRAAAYPTWIPLPACRVIVVAGPPGGLRRYAKAHASPAARIIDIDAIIARLSRGKPGAWISPALEERNRLLADLATANPADEVWLISPSPKQWQRDWWQRLLNARVILHDPGRQQALREALAAGMNPRFVHQWYHDFTNPEGHLTPPVRESAQSHLNDRPSGAPRANASDRGYNSRHGRMRAEQLARRPWCERCEAEGRGRVPATVLNHIKPFRRPDGSIDWKLWGDPKNHSSWCEACHNAHGAKTNRPESPLGCGADGRPLDPAHPWNRGRAR